MLQRNRMSECVCVHMKERNRNILMTIPLRKQDIQWPRRGRVLIRGHTYLYQKPCEYKCLFKLQACPLDGYWFHRILEFCVCVFVYIYPQTQIESSFSQVRFAWSHGPNPTILLTINQVVLYESTFDCKWSWVKFFGWVTI